MKAMVIDSFGGSDRLQQRELPTPAPSESEVLVEICYTSVNPVDWKIREGYLKEMMPHKFPLILGWDAAGTIKAVGKKVKEFELGERVFAYCRKPEVQWGTYAEYITLNPSVIARIPKNLSFAEAAAIPLVSLTAWQALYEFADLRRNENILIHAGAGGVGGMAIQFARVTGSHIFTTASAKNHSYVRELGANVAIDYTTEDFVQKINKAVPQGLDVVFDCAGGEMLNKSYALLREGGRLASIVGQPDPSLAGARKLKAGFVFVSPNGQQLSQIAKLLEEGKVLPPHMVERPLDEAGLALDDNKMGHGRGKVVLRVK